MLHFHVVLCAKSRKTSQNANEISPGAFSSVIKQSQKRFGDLYYIFE
jgi:hypothetical protein